MQHVEFLSASPLVRALGWSLVHSLWQGGAIVLLFAFLMFFMNKFSSRTRYLVSYMNLLLFLVSFVITFVVLYQREKSIHRESGITFQQSSHARVNGTPVNHAEPIKVAETQLDQYQVYTQTGLEKVKTMFKNYYNRHLPFIVTIWLVGILILALRLLGGLAYAQRLKTYRVQGLSETWLKRFNILKNEFGIKKEIKFLESLKIKVPQTIGYFKPVVLIPASMMSGLSPEQVELIMVHELAHIYRADYLFNVIQRIAELLFFYHPAVWWISGFISDERENCCDDLVIERSGEKIKYAKTLVEIEEQKNISYQLAMALNGNKEGQLFNRIKRISMSQSKKANFSEGFVAASILFVCVFVVGFSLKASIYKQPEKAETKKVASVARANEDVEMNMGEEGMNAVSENLNERTKETLTTTAIQNRENEHLLRINKKAAIDNFNVLREQSNAFVREANRQLHIKVNPNYIKVTNSDLFYAVRDKNYGRVHHLLNSGTNPNEVNSDGFTPLMEASKRGMYSIVKELLEHGADLELTYNNGWTALHYAVKENKFGVVQLLLEYGANVNARTDKGRTPLMESVDEDFAIVKLLLEYGADINGCNYEGCTVLMEAVKENSLETVKILLQNGANTNIAQYNGYTALMEASDEQLEISMLLIRFGANVNASQPNGWTALHNAIKNNRADLMMLLLDSGADVNMRYKSMDAYEYAREMNNSYLARLIKKYNPNDRAHAGAYENSALVNSVQPVNVNINVQFKNSPNTKDQYIVIANGTKKGLYKKNGGVILQPVYDDIEMDDHLILVVQNGKQGIFGLDGKVILKVQFDEIDVEDGLFLVLKDGKKGIYNLKGDVILQPLYDQIQYEDGLFLVSRGNQEELYDVNGRPIGR